MSFTFREVLLEQDLSELTAIMESTGLFYGFEIEVALEVLQSFLDHGETSGYYCIVALENEVCAGYAVYGPTPCTLSGWDIYWMAVRKELQGKGLGSGLIKRAEQNIALQGGTAVWIETSGRSAYLPTRKFYEKHQYQKMAELPGFYAPGDSKVIYGKTISFF
ncbi:MAG: GNAT family N-acetyltransferase [Bacteroidales bacterium]